jgi:hypothetical protein
VHTLYKLSRDKEYHKLFTSYPSSKDFKLTQKIFEFL